MSCQITFMGLINFYNVTTQGGQILLPEGRGFGNGIPDHFARFFVPAGGVIDEETSWNEIQDADMVGIGVRVFPIDTPSYITINALERVRDENVEVPQNFDTMPSLNDNALDIDPGTAETIAQSRFARGALSVNRLIEAAVWRLTVASHEGTITITATSAEGEKKLSIRDNTEIILGNMSELGSGHAAEDAPSHYSIYSRLEGTRRALPDPNIDSSLSDLSQVSGHPLVQFIIDNFSHVPRGGCSASRFTSPTAPNSNPGT